MSAILSTSQQQSLRDGGKVLADLLALTADAVKPGITTLELDEIFARGLSRTKATAAFLGYRGFPKHLCISVNEEIVHGIPGAKVLKQGDIVSIDGGVIMNGIYLDAARTVGVGNVSAQAKKLMEVTEKSFFRGIDAIAPGKRIGGFGAAVQQFAEAAGFGVVRDLVGHGIGTSLHVDPNVPNYGPANSGLVLKPGMAFALEPMLTVGSYKIITADDGWAISTKDGSLSAHYENTILITEKSIDIVTLA